MLKKVQGILRGKKQQNFVTHLHGLCEVGGNAVVGLNAAGDAAVLLGGLQHRQGLEALGGPAPAGRLGLNGLHAALTTESWLQTRKRPNWVHSFPLSLSAAQNSASHIIESRGRCALAAAAAPIN